jgi:UPF0271 protein
MLRIDLNADVGENPAALIDGSEGSLIHLVTSANVACGGHAGDEKSMRSVLELCKSAGVAVGAHPGFPDRTGFGRQPVTMLYEALESSLRQQVYALTRIAADVGVTVHHVKPHGALYSLSATDISLAELIARSAAAVDNTLVLVGLAGAPALDAWRKAGFVVVGEAFADRRYESSGSLRPRKYADAVIEDHIDAAHQAVNIVCRGSVKATNGGWLTLQAETLCIHGDTKNAAMIAAAVRRALEGEGVQIAAFSSSHR